jgi:hypothetical protein
MNENLVNVLKNYVDKRHNNGKSLLEYIPDFNDAFSLTISMIFNSLCKDVDKNKCYDITTILNNSDKLKYNINVSENDKINAFKCLGDIIGECGNVFPPMIASQRSFNYKYSNNPNDYKAYIHTNDVLSPYSSDALSKDFSWTSCDDEYCSPYPWGLQQDFNNCGIGENPYSSYGNFTLSSWLKPEDYQYLAMNATPAFTIKAPKDYLISIFKNRIRQSPGSSGKIAVYYCQRYLGGNSIEAPFKFKINGKEAGIRTSNVNAYHTTLCFFLVEDVQPVPTRRGRWFPAIKPDFL